MRKSSGAMLKSRGDTVFEIINVAFMLFIIVITVYPFLNILAISLNDARDSAAGGIGIFPRKWSIDSYESVFRYPGIYNAFLISVARTVGGTALALALTSMAAYVMSKKYLIGYGFVYKYFVVSMFIGGGLIPTFFLYQWLRIYNTFLVYILPSMFGVYNMILMRTFILQLPKELEESAFLDGANEAQVYTKIILPLSKPILATIGLFLAVGQWNSWQDTLFFTNKPELETLQYVLMKVLRQAEAAAVARQAKMSMAKLRTISITPDSIKMAITIVATIPILCVYPFIQKHFVKGMMIGAVKG